MGKPAATLTSFHACPKTTGNVPHVGGPVISASPTVFIGGIPAARKGDQAVCVGPPDEIAAGSSSVFIDGKPAARVGDRTKHGGVVVVGNPTVIIGDQAGPVSPAGAQASAASPVPVTPAGGTSSGALAERIYGGKPTANGGRDATSSSPYVDPNSIDKIADPTRKPRVSEDGKVIPLLGTNEGVPPKQISKYEERGQIAERSFKGKTYRIKKTDQGFPVFTVYDMHLSDEHLGSGDEDAHFRACNERLGELLTEDPALQHEMGLSDDQVAHLTKSPASSEAPQGLTWHHHEDVGRMQLVDAKLHSRFGHTGGMFIWGGGR